MTDVASTGPLGYPSSFGFGMALLALNEGKMVRRAGWNGKGQFVYRTVGNVVSKDFIPKFASLPDSVKVFLAHMEKMWSLIQALPSTMPKVRCNPDGFLLKGI